MDRKVIVLTPFEWESKIELGEALTYAGNFNHYALNDGLSVESFLLRIQTGLDVGTDKEVLKAITEQALEVIHNQRGQIRRSQEYVQNVALVIDHGLKSEYNAQVDGRLNEVWKRPSFLRRTIALFKNN